MNSITIIGRLTKDVELRNGKDIETKFGIFTIASNTTKDSTLFLNCVAFNKKAESLSNYAKKGHLVALKGSLRQRDFQKQDGSKSSIIEMLVDDFQLLEKKEQIEEVKEEHKVAPQETPLDVLDDLPF